jgi:protein gp37
MTLAHRFGYGWNGEPMREFGERHWNEPLRWNKRAADAGTQPRVFPSMCDPFDKDWPDGIRHRFWTLIAATPNLTWLLLTKRIGNARAMMREWWGDSIPANVWIGATVVNRAEMLRDGPKLKATPAAKHFWSYEPALGDLGAVPLELMPDWVIAGGESGPKARPMHPEWVRSIRDQCSAAGVPFLFKQWGEWAPRGRESEGLQNVDSVPRLRMTDRGADGSILGAKGGNDVWMQRSGKAFNGRLFYGAEHNGFPS